MAEDSQYWREIRHNKPTLKKVNESLIYAVMFDSFRAANVQFMIMVMDLEKELSQELKVFV
jgi:hypothetical protein